VLVADNLPELGSDLVSALASLNVNDFAHGFECDRCAGFAMLLSSDSFAFQR
jgi:hypothetical protein